MHVTLPCNPPTYHLPPLIAFMSCLISIWGLIYILLHFNISGNLGERLREWYKLEVLRLINDCGHGGSHGRSWKWVVGSRNGCRKKGQKMLVRLSSRNVRVTDITQPLSGPVSALSIFEGMTVPQSGGLIGWGGGWTPRFTIQSIRPRDSPFKA